MIPGARIELTEADRAYIHDFFQQELPEALAAHIEREARVAEWDRLYLAEPLTRRKAFPWDGAANLVIPLIASATDSILSRIVNTIFSVDPFWTVRPLHKDLQTVAKPTEQFMEWSRNVEFPLYVPVKRWVNEVVKYGWGWLKPRWDIQTKAYFEPTLDGAMAKPIVIRRPVVDHVLVTDIVLQAGIEDEEQAEFMAHRLRLTDGQLYWRQREKVYPLSDEEMEEVVNRKADVTQVHAALAGGRDYGFATKEKLNTIYEIPCDLRLPSHRREFPTVSAIITYHLESKTIMRAIYNPDYYGRRPFVKGTFVEYEGRQESLGICRMLSAMQEELSTVHNQQVDNATLANTRFFLGKRGAIRPGTKVWPGRFLTTQDPEKDLKAFQLGDIYPSMRALEVSIQSFAERRSGVTDYQLGRESSVLGSRATATGTLALIQEGNRRFDLNVRDMRDALSEVGKRVLQLNQQFRPRGLAYFIQGQEGLLTEQMLDLPQEAIERRLGVELTASTAVINREVEKQGLIALIGILNQHLQVGQQAAMVVGNPAMPPAAQEYTAKAFEGLTILMRRLVERFDQKDVTDILPVTMMEAYATAGGAAGTGFGQPTPGPGGDAGMGAVLPAAAGAAADGAGGSPQLQ